jgi:hypothetical protein
MDFIAALGFQRCGIYANRFAFHKAGLRQTLQHSAEDSLMSFGLNQPSGSRDRYMIRSVLVEPDGQELPQCQRIGQPPGDAPLTVQSLEETNHHDTEIKAWRQRRTA